MWMLKSEAFHPQTCMRLLKFSRLYIQGDFVTKVKQINSQSDLIWMTSFAGPSHSQSDPLCTSHFNLTLLYFQSLQSLANWIQLNMSGTSAICTPFQWINNKNTFFCYSLLSGQFQLSGYFTVETTAQTLHRASPCTLVSVPAKITWHVNMFIK